MVALTALLLVAIVQLALALHVRNTLIMCASEGARVAARAGGSSADGRARARQLITASLGEALSREIAVGRSTTAGFSTIEVVVTAPLPVVGLFGPAGGLRVTGRAFAEGQP